MNISEVQKVSGIALMPGVAHVDILPDDNQVWFNIKGYGNTHRVVAAIEKSFRTKSEQSMNNCWAADDKLSYSIYPKGLIISVTGNKEKLPAPTESQEKITLDDLTIFDAVEEERELQCSNTL